MALLSTGTRVYGNASIDTQLTVNTNFTANTLGVYNNTNTFTFGTSSLAANGYTYLPNGVKMTWFTASVTNGAAQALAYPSAFSTNAYSIHAVCASTAQTAAVTIKTTIANATHVTANSIGVNTSWYFVALGV